MVETFDYAESAADALELITEFGRTVSVRRTANSGTAWEPTQTTTDYETKGAKVDWTWRQLQDSSVLVTDQRWLIPAQSIAVTSADKLLVDGVAFQIVRADPLAPAGTVVMYDLQVRA